MGEKDLVLFELTSSRFLLFLISTAISSPRLTGSLVLNFRKPATYDTPSTPPSVLLWLSY
jgi:hypothetical protein